MTSPHFNSTDAVADFHLLGEVSYDDCLALQRRLVYEVSNSGTPRAIVLLCEHPSLITVGRSGSRGHIRIDADTLAKEQLAIRWVSRSGGCVLHAPGQLAVYPIVPLDSFGWARGGYMACLTGAMRFALESLRVSTHARDGSSDVWGRTGLLAAVGVEIEQATTYHGTFLNVAPEMTRISQVDTAASVVAAHEKASMSCLLAERRLPARMTDVHTRVIEGFLDFFELDRHNIHTGHPWLRHPAGFVRESTSGVC